MRLGDISLDEKLLTAINGDVSNIGLVSRKPVLGVSNEVLLKPACSATEIS